MWGMALVVAGSFSACLNDDDDTASNVVSPNAIVTLKTNTSGHLILQLNDSVQLYPVNMATSPYGPKELRAFTNFREAKEGELKEGIAGDMPNVYVNWVDSIRTKGMAPPIKEGDKINYGDDPLEIVDDWSTVCEDGYLTLRFRTYFSQGTVHVLNLVPGAEPFDVYLYHDARGDVSGQVSDGIIAFRLDRLPKTDQSTVTLTLHWKSFSGMKTAKFKYKVRK